MAINKECFFSKDGQQQGPVPASMLVQMAKSGHLLPTALAWNDSMPEWVSASRIKGLFPAPGASVPPLKPAPASPPPAPAFPGQPPPPPQSNQINIIDSSGFGGPLRSASPPTSLQTFDKNGLPALTLIAKHGNSPNLLPISPFSQTAAPMPDSVALSLKTQIGDTLWQQLVGDYLNRIKSATRFYFIYLVINNS